MPTEKLIRNRKSYKITKTCPPHTEKHEPLAMATVSNLSLFSSSTTFLSSSKTQNLLSSPAKKPIVRLRNRTFAVASLHSAEADPLTPKVRNFWQWALDHSVVSPESPVRPAAVPEGLGLVAQRDIAKHEVFLEIPKRFWINPDTVAASDIGSLCSELKPWISVALFLVREKKREDSPLGVYFDILPECTDSTVFWSAEELAELQGTQLLSTTLSVKEYVHNEFLKVEEEIILPHKQLFPYPVTFDDFLWAFGIVRSRAFSRLHGQNLVLVPVADLINHSSNISGEDYAIEIKGAGPFSRDLLFSLRSPVSVKAGEQVLIQYDSNKSNGQLALDYGFIESKSDRDAYTLTLEIPESDPFFDDKLEIAESTGLGETAEFNIIWGQSLPPLMLPYLRLVALGGTDAFLFEPIYRNIIWGPLDSPISHANEEFICRIVRDACKSALSGYHTTIEEDEQLLKGGNLDPRLRIAVGVRVGEKRVLEQIDGIFKERELKLDELEYYQQKRREEFGPVGEPM